MQSYYRTEWCIISKQVKRRMVGAHESLLVLNIVRAAAWKKKLFPCLLVSGLQLSVTPSRGAELKESMLWV